MASTSCPSSSASVGDPNASSLPLPPEVVVTVLTFLDYSDVSSFALVNRAASSLCSDGLSSAVIWRQLLFNMTWLQPHKPLDVLLPASKHIYSTLRKIPRPRHGWFFGAYYLEDEYGSNPLSHEQDSLITWRGAFAAIENGSCFTSLCFPDVRDAVTLSIWLRTAEESNIAYKGGQFNSVYYSLDYEADGEWHLMTMVEHETSSDWYLDGKFVQTLTNKGFLEKWREHGIFCIGRGCGSTNSPAPNQFRGDIAQLALWDRALTPAQIELLYVYGMPRPTPCNSSWQAMQDVTGLSPPE